MPTSKLLWQSVKLPEPLSMGRMGHLHGLSAFLAFQVFESWEYAFVYDDSCARFQRRYQILQNFDAIFIGPIVEDVPEIIDI